MNAKANESSPRQGQPRGATESAHTPGPWRVDDGCFSVRADALPVRAETGLDSGVVCVAVHSTADARLIAAAPDMLAACEAAAKMVNTRFTGPVRDAVPEWYEVQRALEAAIAKAVPR